MCKKPSPVQLHSQKFTGKLIPSTFVIRNYTRYTPQKTTAYISVSTPIIFFLTVHLVLLSLGMSEALQHFPPAFSRHRYVTVGMSPRNDRTGMEQLVCAQNISRTSGKRHRFGGMQISYLYPSFNISILLKQIAILIKFESLQCLKNC